ncbi:MAG: hypothetical protein ACR2K2_07095 [Mycobacteriales bacterium]
MSTRGDATAGRVAFETFYAEWAARQVWVATTVLAGDLLAEVLPILPDRVRTSDGS